MAFRATCFVTGDDGAALVDQHHASVVMEVSRWVDAALNRVVAKEERCAPAPDEKFLAKSHHEFDG
jgi:hypothetical protein